MLIENNVLSNMIDSDINNGTIVIPNSVTSIRYDAFNSCTSVVVKQKNMRR